MTLENIKKEIQSSNYNFLKENEHLGNNIILLGLGGSHAYGTNVESSDVDIRGIALNKKEEILTNKNFEQFCNEKTDTTIYSFNKIITLLSSCNPNTIEMLGLKSEHYLYLSPIGQELIDNSRMFLSKRAIQSFGGYATQQLRRMENKSMRTIEQARQEEHILNSIRNATYDYKQKYFTYDEDSISLYVDKSEREEYDSEIFMDINLKHYPLRDYKSMWSEMNNIVKEYSKVGKRNQNAITHDKLGKHMMHLVRLYLMAFDILENEQIITYREKDLNFLMEIRNGKFLDSNNEPTKDLYDLIDQYEKRLEYAKENTSLPDSPDYNKINEFVMSVNERVVKGEV